MRSSWCRADFILDTCVNSLGTDPLCSRITREQVGTPRPRTPGTVFSIDTLPLNAASIETSGVDVALGYALEFGGAQRLGVTLGLYLPRQADAAAAADAAAEKTRRGSSTVRAGSAPASSIAPISV